MTAIKLYLKAQQSMFIRFAANHVMCPCFTVCVSTLTCHVVVTASLVCLSDPKSRAGCGLWFLIQTHLTGQGEEA